MSRFVAPEQPWARILRAVVGSLAALSTVREVASFGSVATGRADRWSDLDLVVRCADVATTAWLAAAAVRAAKPVLYYRMFTGVAQPSGRYWFEDESPFNRLDVSFYGDADFAAVLRGGVKEGMPIATRTEHLAAGPADPEADAVLRPPWPAIDVTPEETAAGRALYVHLEAAKSVHRGRGDPAAVEAARRALEDALRRGGVSAGWERLARRALAL